MPFCVTYFTTGSLFHVFLSPLICFSCHSCFRSQFSFKCSIQWFRRAIFRLKITLYTKKNSTKVFQNLNSIVLILYAYFCNERKNIQNMKIVILIEKNIFKIASKMNINEIKLKNSFLENIKFFFLRLLFSTFRYKKLLYEYFMKNFNYF